MAKRLFQAGEQPATSKAKKVISQEVQVNDQGLTCKAVVGFHPRWRREETVVTQRTTAHIARKIRHLAVHVCLLLSCSLEQEIEVNDLSIGRMRKPTDADGNTIFGVQAWRRRLNATLQELNPSEDTGSATSYTAHSTSHQEVLDQSEGPTWDG